MLYGGNCVIKKNKKLFAGISLTAILIIVARATRTVTRGKDSFVEEVSKMHDPEFLFETLLARKSKGVN